MTNKEKVQEGFNGLVGAVLDMLGENNASRTLKTAVRAEIYKLCDETIMPMVATTDSRQETANERNFNR